MPVRRLDRDRDGNRRPALIAVPRGQGNRVTTRRAEGPGAQSRKVAPVARAGKRGDASITGVVGIVEHLLETLNTDWARNASGQRLQFVVAYVREVLSGAMAIQRAFGDPDQREHHGVAGDAAVSDGPLDRSAETGQRDTAAGEVFRREGEYWTLGYDGVTVRVKHTTGLFYIAYLLRHPERELHSIELVNALNTADSKPCIEEIGVPDLRTSLGDAGEILDTQAARQYKHRLNDLATELDEAVAMNDLGRIERTRTEIAFLTQELSRGVGLDGHPRRAGSHAERARVNVSRAVATALSRICKQQRPLAKHLRHTIYTGTFCSYAPEPRAQIDWQL